MAKTGPKPTKFNWDEVEKLASYQCTQEEVASFFNVSLEALENACERDFGIKLTEYWASKKRIGRVKLRKQQMLIVEKGGHGAAAMGIWLGKVVLGQNAPEINEPPAIGHSSNNNPGQNDVRDVTPEISLEDQVKAIVSKVESEY